MESKKKMALERIKVVFWCDKIMFFCLCGLAFFLPISKAIIQGFVYLSIAAFLVKKTISREDIPKITFNILFFSYLLICFFSIFISSNCQISTRTFLAKTLRNMVLFFVVAETLNTEKRFKGFLYVLFAAATVLGIDGIYQHFTHKDFIQNRPYFEIPRIFATFPSPNDFGCYLVAIIPFTVVFSFLKTKFKVARFFLIGLFMLLFTCLLLTVSRGSWFAFITSMFFVSIWINSLGIVLFILFLSVIILFPFFNMYLKHRLSQFFVFQDVSSLDRRYMWDAAWKMFLSNPLRGVGLGTFMFNFRKFVDPQFPYIAYAHNCYLQILAEIGIIGLSIFLLALFFYFWKGIKTLNHSARTYSWYVLLASLASVLAYCTQMAVDTMFYALDLGIMFWMLLGMGSAAMHLAGKTKKVSQPA